MVADPVRSPAAAVKRSFDDPALEPLGRRAGERSAWPRGAGRSSAGPAPGVGDTAPRTSTTPVAKVRTMKTRNLGGSGLKISEIAYGNWLTHGSQVEEDAATACVRRALDEGITTFDTADAYANTAAETVLGEALKGERREGLEIFTKVYWPTGPKAHNDHGLSRKHILESINGSLTAAADRLRRPLPGAPLRPRDAARGDDGGVRGRRTPGQGALHRGERVALRRRSGRRTRWRGSCTSRWCPTSRSTPCSGASSRPRWCRPARSSASARSCGHRSRRAC